MFPPLLFISVLAVDHPISGDHRNIMNHLFVMWKELEDQSEKTCVPLTNSLLNHYSASCPAVLPGRHCLSVSTASLSPFPSAKCEELEQKMCLLPRKFVNVKYTEGWIKY